MAPGLVFGCVVPHPPILVPEIAGRRVDKVSETRVAMQQLAEEVARHSPDALVLVSPHAPIRPYSMSIFGAPHFVGGFDDFGVTSVSLAAAGAPDLASALRRECDALGVPASVVSTRGDSHLLDHGALVPLFFLHEAGVRCPLLLISFCALETEVHRRFGQAIAAAARSAGQRVALVCSGDLSHRLLPGAPAGFNPRGREFDDLLVASLRRQDFQAVLSIDDELTDEAGECGYRSVVIALGALPSATVDVLSYQGPFGVGYMVARFLPQSGESTRPEAEAAVAETAAGLSIEEREALRLARLAVESYVRKGAVLKTPDNPVGILAERAGVFVSLKIGGDLRGCIGTFQPCEANVAAEIVRNAISSATRDPRFAPVSEEELLLLEYSIDILSEPEHVDGLSDLDPRRYGVLVESEGRRGLLLPSLEGVDSSEQQVEIARRKAGIGRGSEVQLSRFTVRRIQEPR